MKRLSNNGEARIACAWRWFLAPAALSLALVGCRANPQETKLQYMPDMVDAPTVKAQKDYLPPPEFSVAMHAILYPETVEEAEKVLVMPPRIASDDVMTEQGKVMFDTFCAVCHGPGALGDNHLGPTFPRPPDLTLDVYKQRGDGFYFYRITFGSAIMPSYGHAISPHERWQIVKYLRTLQKAAQ